MSKPLLFNYLDIKYVKGQWEIKAIFTDTAFTSLSVIDRCFHSGLMRLANIIKEQNRPVWPYSEENVTAIKQMLEMGWIKDD